MNTLTPTRGPRRTTMLTATTLLATLLHGAALYGFPWEPANAAQTAVRDEGVTIDLVPAPSLPPEQPAPPEAVLPPAPPAPEIAPEPDPDPIPEPDPEPTPPPKPEPAPVPKPRPPQPPKPRRAAPAASAPSRPAPPSPATTSTSVPSAAKEAAPATATPPAPLAAHANPKPTYPELARKRGQEGLVRLLAHIDEQGKLTELAVAESSGFSLLDEAALKTVRRWRFTLALRAGTPVKGTVIIPIEFVLERR